MASRIFLGFGIRASMEAQGLGISITILLVVADQ